MFFFFFVITFNFFVLLFCLAIDLKFVLILDASCSELQYILLV
jgi:hypothetical protein